jgi:hypothetical protein
MGDRFGDMRHDYLSMAPRIMGVEDSRVWEVF